MLTSLYKISHSSEFNSKVRSDAAAILEKYITFETILISMIYLQIFKVTTPLSDYLQTRNLDCAQAWKLIESFLIRIQV